MLLTKPVQQQATKAFTNVSLTLYALCFVLKLSTTHFCSRPCSSGSFDALMLQAPSIGMGQQRTPLLLLLLQLVKLRM
jgi:hypothetical protein